MKNTKSAHGSHPPVLRSIAPRTSPMLAVILSGALACTLGGKVCPPPKGVGCLSDAACPAGFECVATGTASRSVCLAKGGTDCDCDSECVSGSCQPAQICDPNGLGECPDIPTVCKPGNVGGRCLSGADCESGFCGADGGVGSCCSSESQKCTSDADCCPGLQCATDNSGCHVGPTAKCLIDGGTFAFSTTNPDNECQYCDPYHHSPTAWTNVENNVKACTGGLSDGGAAPNGVCCNGACSAQACPP